MDADAQKQQAADAALELLPESGVLGLGTGSTAKLFIDGVGRLVTQGRKFQGVPTSEASHRQAQALGIPILDPDGPWEIDVCVDGADEVSATLDLIKGGGGAHLREKIVNHAARRNVIIVDESKLSKKLGERWPVPLEILGFAHRAIAKSLEKLGEPVLRERDGAPWRTDSGNYIYDLRVGVITDPSSLERELSLIPGVVETGLFVGRADVVLVASPQGVRRLDRPAD
ncbi:MAG: ribose-5-phosphate isomerase RpiA [Polyangiaceae bacterium]|nr:ribose-5-phosphate isomerase RpiA [Myxococcales bacterium]MCB9590606.1 ribose-5-phosphate isomerase RpiA [Polyangiaceae bacterium]MCB9608128.1 ribose-5-phosphate isomerase RpiA [Polyangiaceae bacterium]